MKKVLMITFDNFDDSEVFYPYNRLLEEDCDIDVASKETRVINGKYHYTVTANKTVYEVKADDYDALMLPGGTAPEKLRLIPEVCKVVADFMAQNKPVASICHGQQLLISAKALKGRKATCYPGIRDDLINAGAVYFDEKVVVDGNLVTSRRPEDLGYLMREFVKLLK